MTACYKQIIYGPTAGWDVPSPDTNVFIPVTGEHKLRTEPEYADDGIQIVGYKYTLSIEMVIYSQNAQLPDIEAEVKRIRDILSIPSQQLTIHPTGVGQLIKINYNKLDIKGGPFPTDIFVEPVASNNAILIRWSVVFYLDACTSEMFYPWFPWGPNMLEFTTELDLDVDDEGDMTFNLHATYRSSYPITDIKALTPLVDALARDGRKSFPGMRRTKRTSLSRDQRTAKIHIQFKEIKSENAFFPYTHDIEVTDELSSDLLGSNNLQGRGFYTWSRQIRGTITLPPRIHKSYAWTVFLKILRARFIRMYPVSRIAAILDVNAPSNQGSQSTIPWYLPLHISITNELYSRKMKFAVSYVVVTDLANLFYNTKICSRVNTTFYDAQEASYPYTLSDQWDVWDTARGIYHPRLSTDGTIPRYIVPPTASCAVPNNLNRSLTGNSSFTAINVPVHYNQCTGELQANPPLPPPTIPPDPELPNYPTIHSNCILPYEFDPDIDNGLPPALAEPKPDKIRYPSRSEAIMHPVVDPTPTTGTTPTDPAPAGPITPQPPESADADVVALDDPISQPVSQFSWLDYHNDFEIIEITNNVHISYLEQPPADYYNTTDEQASTTKRDQRNWRINGKDTDPAPDAMKPLTIERGISRFQLRMKGYAMRASYGIPCPSVISVGGYIAKRTGTPRYVHRQIQKGDVPIYLAMWDITYTIDGDVHSEDIATLESGGIISSGAPGHYV